MQSGPCKILMINGEALARPKVIPIKGSPADEQVAHKSAWWRKRLDMDGGAYLGKYQQKIAKRRGA